MGDTGLRRVDIVLGSGVVLRRVFDMVDPPAMRVETVIWKHVISFHTRNPGRAPKCNKTHKLTFFNSTMYSKNTTTRFFKLNNLVVNKTNTTCGGFPPHYSLFSSESCWGLTSARASLFACSSRVFLPILTLYSTSLRRCVTTQGPVHWGCNFGHFPLVRLGS